MNPLDFGKCNFIKKSSILSDGKTEKILIYRLVDSPEFHFTFKCPACGADNDFKSELASKKMRVDGKNKELYFFNCQKCHSEFTVEKLKAGRGAKSA